MYTLTDKFSVEKIHFTKYIFFTGKGGVGKTSTAGAVAVNLADQGNKVLLISTDPASNLQDIFHIDLGEKFTPIREVEGLFVTNLDPEKAAAEYKKSVIEPYIGKLPDSVVENMKEQLSGSCTVEIAAFNEFTNFLTNEDLARDYNYIIFDTAPTGHTLRMLQLPSAWSTFVSESSHGASCLGQLSGLTDKKESYNNAVKNLSDSSKTTLFLVARPDDISLFEAARSSRELKDIGINNQILVINGVLTESSDDISNDIKEKQIEALNNLPQDFIKHKIYYIPLRSYNILGIANLRLFFKADNFYDDTKLISLNKNKSFQDFLNDLQAGGKKVIFTMGKGGVGKTSVAAAIAIGLAEKNSKVLLASTDPASHLDMEVSDTKNLTVCKIDSKLELVKYQEEVLAKARQTMSEDDIAYIKEDLRSPCTEEIAIFRAFAEIVFKAENEIVVIDTAPTGHTLLLLDATQKYHKEVLRTKGEIPISVQRLLPRLRDEKQTEIVIVTLPEATPVLEAKRLADDLKRAGIHNKWWVINRCFSMINTDNQILKVRASSEKQWLDKVNLYSKGNSVTIPWLSGNVIKNILNM